MKTNLDIKHLVSIVNKHSRKAIGYEGNFQCDMTNMKSEAQDDR